MKHPRLISSCTAALGLPLLWIGALGTVASAQHAPALPPPFVQPPENVVPRQPAQPAEPLDTTDEVPLGHAYESLSEGISFRTPADCKMVGVPDLKFIAEWADPAREWTLKLGRITMSEQMPMVSGVYNSGRPRDGILDVTVRNLQAKLPGSELLKHDVTNTRDAVVFDKDHPEDRNNVGLIIIRYTVDSRRQLSQQAIIRSNYGVYYVLTLTTPGRSLVNPKPAEDAAEAQAADAFSRMIDSIRLLDRKAIKVDQDARLYNMRVAIALWNVEKLHKKLITEQWFRVIKNGKDVGYTYVTESTSGGIPKALTAKQMEEAKSRNINGPQDFAPKGDGLLIGVRSRMIGVGVRADKTKGPVQTDIASWLWSSIDRKNENFSRIVLTDDHLSPKKSFIQELGASDKRVKRHVIHAKVDAKPGELVIPKKDDAQVEYREEWELDVTQSGNYGVGEPMTRQLPVFYLPQAYSHLLPRLLPLDRVQGYMCATYVSDAGEVVARYLDVMPEQWVTFNGNRERVVPIRDRLGLEGAPTYHYFVVEANNNPREPTGRYIGSENREQKLIMIPTDDTTLTRIWKDANLTRPGGVERGGAANADATRQ